MLPLGSILVSGALIVAIFADGETNAVPTLIIGGLGILFMVAGGIEAAI